jgi:DNA end-binding protein Ku
MAERSIWKGAISIGGSFLIPMKLVKATDDHSVAFHEYHVGDMARVGRKQVCKECGMDLGKEDIIKGYEVTKGQVVTFTEQDFESLPLNTVRIIEVDRFVDAGEINPMLFEKAYYIVPDEIGIKALNLFVHGLKKLGKVAIGKVAMRNREHLCALRAMNGGLVVSTLFYVDEIRSMPNAPTAQFSEMEADLITQVMKKFSKPFNHADFQDNYTEAVKALAQAKLEGKTITVTSAPQKTVSLEEALKSLVDN